MSNIDKQEIKKFSDIADEWWNKDGDFKPLHVINPLRANFIKEKTSLDNKKILDVGCGGGLLTEALHDFGAEVTGIDAAGPGIKVAKIHADKNKKDIRYYEKTAEELIKDNKWPCYFFSSDTTGEKDFEEFFTQKEILDMKSFKNFGIIKNSIINNNNNIFLLL